MIYCIDIDGILCNDMHGDYQKATPYRNVVDKVNQLHDKGHTIKIFTGRGSKSGIDWKEFTKKQLIEWGLKYHELIMGKPSADVFIDDKTINIGHLLNKEKLDVPQTWGGEKFIINCPEYCGKFLYLNKDTQCSYHYHKKKKETFLCLEGEVALTVKGEDYVLNPLSKPKTIKPGTPHRFRGIVDSIILEISTHDSPNDVVRLT